MKLLSHPFRLDGNGAAVCVTEGSDQHAAELCGHVLSCMATERALGPDYGLPDPTGKGVDPLVVASVIELCEPDLVAVSVDVDDDEPTGLVTVRATVAFKDEEGI